MTKDIYGQEVKIGDWIASIEVGSRNVEVGKIAEFTKHGTPKYKTGVSAQSKITGKGMNWTGEAWVTSPRFIKINPTKDLDQKYEIT